MQSIHTSAGSAVATVCRRLAQKLACAARASFCQSVLQNGVPFSAEHLSSHQYSQRCSRSGYPAVEAALLGIAHQLLMGAGQAD